MNPFEAYAEQAATVVPDRRADRPSRKPPSALDLKMAEKQRLSKAYLALRRADRIAILAAEPRLKDFMRYLLKVGPSDGDELLDAVAQSWLPTAPRAVRSFALDRIDRRSDKIRLSLGLTPFDDPLPPAAGVYQKAHVILSAAGRL